MRIGEAINRREFLVASSGSAALAVLPEGVSAASGRSPIIDTHLHCFAGPDDKRFPFHQRAPYRPAASASPEHLLKCMAGAGIDHAIVVHPEPYQDDHRYLDLSLIHI